MPIKFTTKSGTPSHGDGFGSLQDAVRSHLHLNAATQIAVGVTHTTLRQGGVTVTLPFGAPAVKNDAPAIGKSRDDLFNLLAAAAGSSAPVPGPKTPAPFDDMDDEDWVQAVAEQLFPGILHLHEATAMHQPVLGTSAGSVYKTCFIGPELKIASRIHGTNVSFRVTTNQNLAPQGACRATLMRLGTFSEYDDRLTCHAAMSGPYTAETAGEYRALFGAFYAALRPWITSGFPSIAKLAEGTK